MKNLIVVFLLITTALCAADTIKLYIDADTANEVDDLYAIVRALIEPEFDIVGLGSAQWQVSHWATDQSLEDSQRLNDMLLAFLHKQHIPAPRGGHARLYDWGADIAQHSAAAYFIIEQAHAMPDGEKLVIANLGALTNVASAILIDPSIVPKIKLYLLGTTYDFENSIWRKRDFNCVMDIQAINVVLDAKGLETHIMPGNVAAAMKFDMQRCKEQFAEKNDLLDFLYQRWVDHKDGGRYSRTIWDLSVIEALVHPEWAEVVQVAGPPENGNRTLFVYKRINADEMIDDFYETIADFYRE